MSAHAGEEFLDAEWLGDVVIRTSIESFDFGAFVVANGEDDDGRRKADTYGAGDLDARHTRHHEVGHDEVRRPFAKDLETFFGVVGGAKIVALCGKSCT